MKTTILSLSAMALLSTMVIADTSSDINTLKEQIADLQSNQQVLVDETSNIKTGFSTVDSSFSHNGMGAAASKVYKSKSALSIGGYGVMYYANQDNKNAISDLYLFVPYIGYKFSDNIILNTEIEFEHGGANAEAAQAGDADASEGYAVIEFMYLDFLITKAFNIQVGKTLIPMGIINLRHEPTLYNSVQKPLTEKYIIPATWASTGINTYGTFEDIGIAYNAGITQALDLNNADNGAKAQIRDARPSPTGKTTMEKIAFVGRFDYVGTAGLLTGASMYYGSATQGSVTGSTALIYDIHTTYEKSGFKVKALYSATSISNAENIASNPDNGTTSMQDSNGYYVNLEYDALASFSMIEKLPIFVQYDYINPAATVVNSLGNTTNSNVGETTTTTVGINYFAHEQVVLKMDYAMTDIAAAGETDYNTFSLGMGFIF